MTEEKKDYIKIGRCYEINGGMAFECGHDPNAKVDADVCFKDEEIFINNPDGVCFIEELSFHKWFDLVYNGKVSEDEEEEIFEKCEHDELQIFIWDEERISSGLYNEAVWTHNSILEKCVEFLRKHPNYKLDPEDLAYKVFMDARSCIKPTPWFKGSPLEEPDSFTAAAIALLK